MFDTNTSSTAHLLNNKMNGNGLLNPNLMHLDSNQVNNHLNVNHIYQNQLQLNGEQMQNKNVTVNFSNFIRNISNSTLPAASVANHQLYNNLNLNKLQLTNNNPIINLNNYHQNNVQNNFNNHLQNTSTTNNSTHHFPADFLNSHPQLQTIHQQQQQQQQQNSTSSGNLSSLPLLNGNLNNNTQLPLQPKQLPQHNIPNVFCNLKNTNQTPTKYHQQQQQQQQQNNSNLFGNNSPSNNSNNSITYTFNNYQSPQQQQQIQQQHQKSTSDHQLNNHMAQSHQFFNSIHQHPNIQNLQQQQQLQQLYLQLNNQNNPNILNRNLINPTNNNFINRNLFNNININSPTSTDSNYGSLLSCQNLSNLNLPSTPINKSSSFLLNNCLISTPNRSDQFNSTTSSFTFNSNGSGGSLSSNKSNSSGSDNMINNSNNSSNNSNEVVISGQLKNFKILKQIGNGQFSVVYRAIYIPTGQFVALKCIRILELEDMKTRLDCINEISLLQRLDHPNIIKFYTSFVECNELYIVLELADCGDLAQLIKHFRKIKKTIPEKRIWGYFKQIANGLVHLHEQTILHRDLKPPNVFITQNGVVKLGDLGLSKYYGANCKGNCCCDGPGFCLSNKEKNNNSNIDTRAVLENHFNTLLSQKNIKNNTQNSASLSNLIKACTQQVRNNISDHKAVHYKFHKHLMQDEASSLIGTPFYMSKERLSENCKYDSQSDIWSLGCILYEMAALQSPFYGEKLNLISLCQKIVSCNYPPLVNNYSVALRALVASCLDSDPKKRPDIMLICDIAKFCSELSGKELHNAHLYSPMFKTLKVDEILNSDKLNQAKMNSLSPIKSNIYSMNLNGLNMRNNKNNNNHHYNHLNNDGLNHNSMTATNTNLNHLAVPNQLLINNNVVNNTFFTTNDSNYNDLQSIDSDNTDSLSMLKFWKSDPDNEKNYI